MKNDNMKTNFIPNKKYQQQYQDNKVKSNKYQQENFYKAELGFYNFLVSKTLGQIEFKDTKKVCHEYEEVSEEINKETLESKSDINQSQSPNKIINLKGKVSNNTNQPGALISVTSNITRSPNNNKYVNNIIGNNQNSNVNTQLQNMNNVQLLKNLNNNLTNNKMNIFSSKNSINQVKKRLPLNVRVILYKQIQKNLPIGIIISLSKKHNSNPEKYNKMIIHNLINNRNSHQVALFKDFMIYDYLEEFIKRFYSRSECSDRVPKLTNYYKNYLKFFCNPVFRDLIANDIVQIYGDQKAELYYNRNYGKEMPIKKKKNNDTMKIIFGNTLKEEIQNVSLSVYQSLLQTENDFYIKNKIDSLSDLNSMSDMKSEISEIKNKTIKSKLVGYNNNCISNKQNTLYMINNNMKTKYNKNPFQGSNNTNNINNIIENLNKQRNLNEAILSSNQNVATNNKFKSIIGVKSDHLDLNILTNKLDISPKISKNSANFDFFKDIKVTKNNHYINNNDTLLSEQDSVCYNLLNVIDRNKDRYNTKQFDKEVSKNFYIVKNDKDMRNEKNQNNYYITNINNYNFDNKTFLSQLENNNIDIKIKIHSDPRKKDIVRANSNTCNNQKKLQEDLKKRPGSTMDRINSDKFNLNKVEKNKEINQIYSEVVNDIITKTQQLNYNQLKGKKDNNKDIIKYDKINKQKITNSVENLLNFKNSQAKGSQFTQIQHQMMTLDKEISNANFFEFTEDLQQKKDSRNIKPKITASKITSSYNQLPTNSRNNNNALVKDNSDKIYSTNLSSNVTQNKQQFKSYNIQSPNNLAPNINNAGTQIEQNNKLGLITQISKKKIDNSSTTLSNNKTRNNKIGINSNSNMNATSFNNNSNNNSENSNIVIGKNTNTLNALNSLITINNINGLVNQIAPNSINQINSIITNNKGKQQQIISNTKNSTRNFNFFNTNNTNIMQTTSNVQSQLTSNFLSTMKKNAVSNANIDLKLPAPQSNQELIKLKEKEESSNSPNKGSNINNFLNAKLQTRSTKITSDNSKYLNMSKKNEKDQLEIINNTDQSKKMKIKTKSIDINKDDSKNELKISISVSLNKKKSEKSTENLNNYNLNLYESEIDNQYEVFQTNPNPYPNYQSNNPNNEKFNYYKNYHNYKNSKGDYSLKNLQNLPKDFYFTNRMSDVYFENTETNNSNCISNIESKYINSLKNEVNDRAKYTNENKNINDNKVKIELKPSSKTRNNSNYISQIKGGTQQNINQVHQQKSSGIVHLIEDEILSSYNLKNKVFSSYNIPEEKQHSKKISLISPVTKEKEKDKIGDKIGNLISSDNKKSKGSLVNLNEINKTNIKPKISRNIEKIESTNTEVGNYFLQNNKNKKGTFSIIKPQDLINSNTNLINTKPAVKSQNELIMKIKQAKHSGSSNLNNFETVSGKISPNLIKGIKNEQQPSTSSKISSQALVNKINSLINKPQKITTKLNK